MALNIDVGSLHSIEAIRDAVNSLKKQLNESIFFKGQWQFFQITVNSAVTNLKYSHNLKFIPKDIITLSVTGSGAVTWAYSSFDSTFLVLSTTGPCIIRAYVGRHAEGSDA